MVHLEREFLTTLDHLNTHVQPTTAKKIKSVIDLTLLDELATPNALSTLQEKAYLHQVAAICVLPQHLNVFTSLTHSARATVMNFPSGQEPFKAVLTATKRLLSEDCFDELDYVFAYRDYLNNNSRDALLQIEEISILCQHHNKKLKVILETGAFPNAQGIYQASCNILSIGCDFLKTSTGKINVGATPIAAFSLLKAIIDSNSHAGLKVSGGIKTIEEAKLYIALAEYMLKSTIDPSWFRIGASSLIDKLNPSL